jgi:hypothetical protein
MVWNRIDPLLGLKIMVSVWVLMFTLLAFRSINRLLAITASTILLERMERFSVRFRVPDWTAHQGNHRT